MHSRVSYCVECRSNALDCAYIRAHTWLSRKKNVEVVFGARTPSNQNMYFPLCAESTGYNLARLSINNCINRISLTHEPNFYALNIQNRDQIDQLYHVNQRLNLFCDSCRRAKSIFWRISVNKPITPQHSPCSCSYFEYYQTMSEKCDHPCCDICISSTFVTLLTVYSNGLREYKCFNTTNHKQVHMWIQCPYCPKRYVNRNRRSTVKKHIELQHTERPNGIVDASTVPEQTNNPSSVTHAPNERDQLGIDDADGTFSVISAADSQEIEELHGYADLEDSAQAQDEHLSGSHQCE